MGTPPVEHPCSEAVLDVHRALASLQEELEAVDLYHQRAAATGDEALRALLRHNRDEEMEHAAMLMAWLGRNLEGMGAMLDRYLDRGPGTGPSPEGSGRGLGLGDLGGRPRPPGHPIGHGHGPAASGHPGAGEGGHGEHGHGHHGHGGQGEGAWRTF